MLYSILKPLVTITLKGYFRKIDVSGAEHLEYDGAIYVSNHPSAVFDPLLAAITAKKELNFIASAEWFGKGIQNWIFRNQFNMIPVYRPWLMKDGQKVDNQDTFHECYSNLKNGKRIIIYPEASSITVPWLRELKTGTARIKIGAEADDLKAQKIPVIPIGLNYDNAHRFQNKVLICVGQPIDFTDLEAQHYEDDKERAKVYTDRIAEKMQEQVLHIQREEDAKLIKAVLKLLTDALMRELELSKNDVVGAFKVKKRIIDRIEQIKANSPQELEALEAKLFDYIHRFEALGFRRFNPFETSSAKHAQMAVLLFLGAPILAFGLMLNGIPYWFSEFFFRTNFLHKVYEEHKQGEINPSFAGTLAYGVGSISFILWYILIAIVASQFVTWYIAWPVSWFVSFQLGKFTLAYYRLFKKYARILKWNSYKRSNAQEAENLLNHRTELLQSLMHLYHSNS